MDAAHVLAKFIYFELNLFYQENSINHLLKRLNSEKIQLQLN